jgi:WhiB family redox-sensing transcriptional regulator
MWNLLDDDGGIPSEARTPAPAPTGNVLPLFAAVDEDEGLLSWQERALCAQTDPEAFFPEKGGSTREAKKVCTQCEVRAECLEYALANDERFGIWGGLSERERRKLKRRVV